MMRARTTIARLLALLALLSCGALLADSFFDGALCPLGSDCAAVTTLGGVPLLPTLGVLGFGFLFVLSLFPQTQAFALVRPLALAAGLGGLVLSLLQLLVLGRACTLCLVADCSAVALAGTAALGKFAADPVSRPRRSAWLTAALLVLCLPCLVAWLNVSFPVPERIRSHWVPGKITVVEVNAFECKQCLAAAGITQAFVKEQADLGVDLHFVRIVVPMPRLDNSWVAARAYLAAEAQGKGEEMAERLFWAASRFPDACRELARSLGLDLNRYDKMVNDSATNAKLDADLAWAKAHSSGLPVIWVQDQRVSGVPTLDRLRAALERARRHGSS